MYMYTLYILSYTYTIIHHGKQDSEEEGTSSRSRLSGHVMRRCTRQPPRKIRDYLDRYAASYHHRVTYTQLTFRCTGLLWWSSILHTC
jgi:hypothetical protein